MAELEIVSVYCQGKCLLHKRTDVINYLKVKSVIYIAYKTQTSVLELIKKLSYHVGIMIALLVLTGQTQGASQFFS